MSFEIPLKLLHLFQCLILIISFCSYYLLVQFSSFDAKKILDIHMSLGTFSLLCSLFINTCLMFYFIGTSTWIKDQYSMIMLKNSDFKKELKQIYQAANKLKGRTFPGITISLALAIFSFIYGGEKLLTNSQGSTIHIVLVSLLIILNILMTPVYFKAINKNYWFLNDVSEMLES